MVAEGAVGLQLAQPRLAAAGIDGTLTSGMEWVQYTAAGLLSGAPRPYEHLRCDPRGRADPEAARWFQEPPHRPACRCESCRTPGTPRAWATAPRVWQAHVISFLNAALEGPSADPR